MYVQKKIASPVLTPIWVKFVVLAQVMSQYY